MSDNLVYDVAIIGGGLAGLSLAIQCADAQYSVVLFEKEEYPYHKVCGEYISLESWDFLHRIGADLKSFNLPLIKTLHLSDVKGKTYSFNLPLGGFGISRHALDHRLFKIAQSKGVTVFTNCKVTDVSFSNDLFTVSSAGRQVRAKVAAGSFGKRSNLDIKWKRSFVSQKTERLNNYVGIKYHIKYEHDKDSISLHNFYNGYCGLSKIEDDKSCLCYLTTASNLKSCGNSIEEMQRQVLFKNPKLKSVFTSAEFLYKEPLAISQISFSKKSQVENHVLMLGDAAGMISPLCGNGMSMAMHSSKISFDCIKLFLEGKVSRNIMEEKYEADWKKAFSLRLWVGRNVQRFFGGNTSTSLFLQTMHSVPPLAKALIKSTHGTSF
ncbi:NAD(P)/FAD-dependent oxidoreductase [Segetibacter aerophilus]|uniref:FAD-dependent oxidoreductase n=1 Tax=Segetibacter aerophilus TaxID=670293 RepID=A0A512BFA9_9BACT|nr:NAD(P)/FAD-dependent oxidoreductase [Segetibacter aerophilus]GEO10575.1 FAD-dependent oxidoreductase [Segetibacter aerophilus]